MVCPWTLYILYVWASPKRLCCQAGTLGPYFGQAMPLWTHNISKRSFPYYKSTPHRQSNPSFCSCSSSPLCSPCPGKDKIYNQISDLIKSPFLHCPPIAQCPYLPRELLQGNNLFLTNYCYHHQHHHYRCNKSYLFLGFGLFRILLAMYQNESLSW